MKRYNLLVVRSNFGPIRSFGVAVLALMGVMGLLSITGCIASPPFGPTPPDILSAAHQVGQGQMSLEEFGEVVVHNGGISPTGAPQDFCPYDYNGDDIIGDDEIVDLIGIWIAGSITDTAILEAVGLWINSTLLGCVSPQPPIPPTPTPPETGSWTVKYTWSTQTGVYITTFEIPKALYDYYVDKKPGNCYWNDEHGFVCAESNYTGFVNNPNDDTWLGNTLLAILNTVGIPGGEWGYFLNMSVLLYFVQTAIQYDQWEVPPEYDPANWQVRHPYGKQYVRHPVETMAEGYGDCEDTAILYAALIEVGGGDAQLIRLQLPTMGHIAVGVKIARKHWETLQSWLPTTCQDYGFSHVIAWSYDEEPGYVYLFGETATDSPVPLGCSTHTFEDIQSWWNLGSEARLIEVDGSRP